MIKGFTIKVIIQEADKLKDNLNEAGYSVSIEGLRDLHTFINKLELDNNKEREIKRTKGFPLLYLVVFIAKY